MDAQNNKLTYYVLDVFSETRYQGNPLSVVCINEDLKLQEYQNISREFGYSETSFIYYSEAGSALKVRSFTPTGFEVNGAGHNLLGAVYLAVIKGWDIFRGQKNEQYVLMKDEHIRVSIKYSPDNSLSVNMLQQPATILKTVPVDAIAEAIGLQTGDLLLNNWEPSVVKTEVTHLMVPVKNIDILNKAVSNKTLLSKLSKAYDFEGCYIFTISEDGSPYIAQSRFFNPGIGIDEDAATGSAAGPLAGFLFDKGYIQPETDYAILQGVKMEQPSTIRFRITDEGIWISGSAVIVMEGDLYL